MKIHSPNRELTGRQVYGVTPLEFVDGVAITDDDLPTGVLLYLRGAGYVIEASGLGASFTSSASSSMTKAELVAMASEQGIDLGAAKTKPEILAAIAAHLDATSQQAPDVAVDEQSNQDPAES